MTLIAKACHLPAIVVQICKGDEGAESFITKKATGYSTYCVQHDDILKEEGGGTVASQLALECEEYNVWTKVLLAPVVVQAPPAPVVVAPVAEIERASPVSVAESAADVEKPISVASLADALPTPPPTTTATDFQLEGDSEDDAIFNEDQIYEEDCEEDQVLDALIEEYTAKNGAEPTKEIVESWLKVMKEASEEAMLANFGKPSTKKEEIEINLDGPSPSAE